MYAQFSYQKCFFNLKNVLFGEGSLGTREPNWISDNRWYSFFSESELQVHNTGGVGESSESGVWENQINSLLVAAIIRGPWLSWWALQGPINWSTRGQRKFASPKRKAKWIWPVHGNWFLAKNVSRGRRGQAPGNRGGRSAGVCRCVAL
jgi:hypothetical protein